MEERYNIYFKKLSENEFDSRNLEQKIFSDDLEIP